MTDTVTVALIGTGGTLAGILLQNVLQRIAARRRARRVGIPKLQYHDVFNEVNTLILRVDTFRVNDPGKQKAIRYVLKNGLIIARDEMMQLAENIENCDRKLCSLDEKGAHLINRNAKAIQNIMRRIGELAHAGNNPESDREVLCVINDRLLQHIEPKFASLAKAVEEYARMEAAESCKFKQYLTFIVWSVILPTLYVDLQSVANDINGELAGMHFQGVEIGH